MAAANSIFISYRREDAADVAGRIRDWLVQERRVAKDDVIMDVTAILPGADFMRVIEEKIGQCRAMIVVISPSWLAQINAPAGVYLRAEAEAALRRNLLLIPVLVNGTQMPAAESLPASLRALTQRNAKQIRPDSFEYDMDFVRKALGIKPSTRVAGLTGISALLLVGLTLGILSQTTQWRPQWPFGNTPGPTATATTPADSPTATPVAYYAAVLPGSGCDAASAVIQWTTIKGQVACGAGVTQVTKMGTYGGATDPEYAELRFKLASQAFPTSYTVGVTITNLRDANSSTGGCAGILVHTNDDGSTFEELTVCGDGEYAIIKIVNHVEVARVDMTNKMPASDIYYLTADVNSGSVALTVNNGAGYSDKIVMDGAQALNSTSYIGLGVFWRNTGATAQFSSFRYSASA